MPSGSSIVLLLAAANNKPDRLAGLVSAAFKSIAAKVIEQLDPIYRVVFLLRDVEDISTEETAKIVGISVPAVPLAQSWR